jgi:putative DNA primase/helicase
MTAETIAKALRGHRVGSRWIACCPAHNDRTPSLSLRYSNDGKLLVRCHAGCDQHLVISTLRSMALWPDQHTPLFKRIAPLSLRQKTELDHDEDKRTEAALKLWHSSKPSPGTLVESYFRSRGLHLPPPPTLRFISFLKHPSGESWPAMIALVTHGPNSSPIGIHRTYLARDGAGKAPVIPQKMMLGPCRGGAVRLAGLGNVLMIGEGIETCAAAMQQTGQPAWAALSTSGLRTLELPPGVRDVIILADGDDAGEEAARDCALRLQREGRRVRVDRAPKGMDFNDVVLSQLHPQKGMCNE